MIFTYFTMMIGIFISFISAYYSVVGLTNIFTGSFWSIIIMGATLEVGKITSTLWLHRYWNQGRWWLKTYLSIAVVVLMFITSMGIFGGLSKAHIEQTSASQESVAQVQRYDSEIKRQTGLIERYETRIKQLESGGGGADASIQSQIDGEQKRIDTAYARIQPQIDEQNKIIEGQSKLFSDQITKIDSEVAQLQKYVDDKEVGKAQAMVGIKVDNDWGPGTGRAVTAWKARKAQERNDLVNKIQDINKDNSNIQAAREEVKRLRATVDVQVAESNKTIVKLRESLGKNKSEDIDGQLKEQMSLLKEAQTALDIATKEKYKIESEYRKLEAEVGPVKYIAEFVYGGEADKNMLEQAVRWVIITIIFVFDPLAVLLLLASQYSFEFHRREKEEKESVRKSLAELLAATPGDNLEDIVVEEPATESFDKKYADELIEKLNKELDLTKQVRDSYIKAHDDEEQDNLALHDKIEALESEINSFKDSMITLMNERDRVFEENIDLRIDYTALEDALTAMIDERDQLYKELSAETERATEIEIVEPETADIVEHVEIEPVFQGLESAYDEPTADSDEPITVEFAKSFDIKTAGVTKEAQLFHPSEEYIKYNGKFMSMDALRSMRPDLILKASDPINRIMFGNKFPEFAKTGDIYIRTDVLPNSVYKFNDTIWIDVDKTQNTSYLHYTPYIQYLIQKIESGEYDAELLTDHERDEIEHHLKSK